MCGSWEVQGLEAIDFAKVFQKLTCWQSCQVMRLKYFSRVPTPAVAAPSCNCYLFYFFLLFEIYATEIKMQILRISLLVFCCYISSYRKSFLNHGSLFQWSLYFLPFSIKIHIFRWDWNWRFPAILQYSWCLLFNVSLCISGKL